MTNDRSFITDHQSPPAMRFLGSLIAYFAIATVLTGVLGTAYLWRSNRLTDEKMFRLMALLHDVDIDKIAEEKTNEPDETPGEETSVEEVERQREVLLRNHEIKSDALRRGRLELDNRLAQVGEQIRRTDELAREIETRLTEEISRVSKQEVTKVVAQLESISAEIAKDQLLRTLDDADGMEKVILLMNNMQSSSLKKLLKTFATADELAKLHTIHSVMLEGGPRKAELEKFLKEMQQNK
jgi:hypothetical protein